VEAREGIEPTTSPSFTSECSTA